MESKATKAKNLFENGYNCSQAVIGAFADGIGLDLNTALKISSGFGGGMGRMREVCGAVSAAIMVLGLKYGNDRISDKDKKETYELIQSYAREFKKETGTIICRELLGETGNDTSPNPTARSNEYYEKRPCKEIVELAAKILSDFDEKLN